MERIQKLVDEFIGAGGNALVVTTDVTDAGQMKKLAETAIQKFGRIDVLLNNTGLMPQSPLDKLKIDEWDRMIDVNIKGVL